MVKGYIKTFGDITITIQTAGETNIMDLLKILLQIQKC